MTGTPKVDMVHPDLPDQVVTVPESSFSTWQELGWQIAPEPSTDTDGEPIPDTAAGLENATTTAKAPKRRTTATSRGADA